MSEICVRENTGTSRNPEVRTQGTEGRILQDFTGVEEDDLHQTRMKHDRDDTSVTQV
jgi:hypothetical protein